MVEIPRLQAKKVGRTAANVDRIGSLGVVFSRLLFEIVRFIAGFQNCASNRLIDLQRFFIDSQERVSDNLAKENREYTAMLKGRIGNSVVALLASVSVLLPPLSSVAEDKIALGRYVRVTTVPTASQLNSLETVISINFPKGQVDTIGAAASYLLIRSGYQLADVEAASNPRHEQLLNFPLPDVQRDFELVTVMSVLDALGGPSYEPRVDHVERTVTYRLRDEGGAAPAKTENTNSSEPVLAAAPRCLAHVRKSNQPTISTARPSIGRDHDR